MVNWDLSLHTHTDVNQLVDELYLQNFKTDGHEFDLSPIVQKLQSSFNFVPLLPLYLFTFFIPFFTFLFLAFFLHLHILTLLHSAIFTFFHFDILSLFQSHIFQLHFLLFFCFYSSRLYNLGRGRDGLERFGSATR